MAHDAPTRDAQDAHGKLSQRLGSLAGGVDHPLKHLRQREDSSRRHRHAMQIDPNDAPGPLDEQKALGGLDVPREVNLTAAAFGADKRPPFAVGLVAVGCGELSGDVSNGPQERFEQVEGVHAHVAKRVAWFVVLRRENAATVVGRTLAAEVIDRDHVADLAPAQERHGTLHEWVEQQRVIHTHRSFGLARSLDDALAIFLGGRERLLHQDVAAEAEGLQRDGGVAGGRGQDVHDIHPGLHQTLQRGIRRANSKPVRHGAGPRRVDVGDADDLHVRHAPEGPHVKFADLPGADQSGTNRPRHARTLMVDSSATHVCHPCGPRFRTSQRTATGRVPSPGPFVWSVAAGRRRSSPA